MSAPAWLAGPEMTPKRSSVPVGPGPGAGEGGGRSAYAFDRVGGHEAQAPAALGCDPLQDIAHGGKVLCVADDHGTVGLGVDGGHGQFVEVDGRRVAHHHLARCRPDQLSDAVAHRHRQVGPPVPPTDEVAAPLVEQAGEGGRGRPGPAAEGVAI